MAAENFFSRWSRRKQQTDEQTGAPEQAEQAPVPMLKTVDGQLFVQPPVQTRAAEASALTSADVARLTLESDYGAFMSHEVDTALRRSAMKKLFFNPQLSVMDGLDIYIDDYNKTTPIPAAMLSALEQAKAFLTPVDEAVPAPPPSLNAAPLEAAGPASPAGQRHASADTAAQAPEREEARETPSALSAVDTEQHKAGQDDASQTLAAPDAFIGNVPSKDFSLSDDCPAPDEAASSAVHKGHTP